MSSVLRTNRGRHLNLSIPWLMGNWLVGWSNLDL